MKKLLFIILFLTGAFVIYNRPASWTNKNKPTKTSQNTKQISVDQKIAAENNDQSFKKYAIEENKTALDLLKQTTSVVTKGEKENAFVIEINGRAADAAKKEFWSLYINDKISSVGAGSYLLKNGDKIEWKIENY